MASNSLLKRLLVVAALIAPIYAQWPAFSNSEYDITAGSPFLIAWTGDGTIATISLMTGPTSNLQKVEDIATTSTSPYSWTPSTSLAQDAYALSITQSGHTNYSPQFTIKGVTPGVIVVTATAPRSAPSIQQAQLAPTPAYVANGGLSGNGTYPYYATVSGTGIALPTGTSALGQYAVFEGAAAGRGCGVLRSLLAAMVLFVPFL